MQLSQGSPSRPGCSIVLHLKERVAGVYRQRLMLASGRFAMIDEGIGFQLVPWRPALERHLGREISGVATGGGRVIWSLERKIGLGI